MGLYDNVGAIGGNNYLSLMSDPYFLMALQGYNPNFKSSQTSQSQGTEASEKTQATTDSISNNVASNILPIPQEESSGGTGFVTGALATAIIGGGALLLLKGRKSGGVVNMVKSWFGKGETASESVASKLKQLTAVKGPDGKIRFMAPDKTTTLRGNSVNRFVTQNCLHESVTTQRQAFNPVSSKIDTFVFSSGADRYVVKTENGVITAVKDKQGNDILKRMQDAESGHADALRLEGLENILKELGKTKDVDKSVLSGVTNIRYTNTYGDDVLQMTLKKYGETPQLRKFTTLQRYDFNDNEIQALKLTTGEKAFANSKFYKDGKLVDGVKVSRFSDNIGGGNIGNFEGEKLVSITKPDGSVLPVDSAGYEAIVNKYQKDIEKLVNRVLVKRDYIPNGAVIVPA